MPSDERARSVLAAFAGSTDAFRAAMATTAEQVQSYLAMLGTNHQGHVERCSAELGQFATGRIDSERFAALFGDGATADKQTRETIEAGLETLQEMAARKDDLVLFNVPSGESLLDVVDLALADIGRVFGAAHTVELSRTGRYKVAAHAHSLGSFPYARWNRTERRVAPPIIVQVDGSDLRVAGLADFLDGGQKIVLIVRGNSAPAPLVRLITPDTFVLQTAGTETFDRFAAWNGPGVAALVPESAAHFVHDPEAGTEVWDRLTIVHLPDKEPRTSFAGLSATQQLEELRQLQVLATRPAVAATSSAGQPAGATGEPAPADPIDKLAAWLLREADLSGLE